MSNCFHLLVEIPEANLVTGMKLLLNDPPVMRELKKPADLLKCDT